MPIQSPLATQTDLLSSLGKYKEESAERRLCDVKKVHTGISSSAGRLSSRLSSHLGWSTAYQVIWDGAPLQPICPFVSVPTRNAVIREPFGVPGVEPL